MNDQMQTAPQVPSDDQTGDQSLPPTPVPLVGQTTEVEAVELVHYDEEIKSEKIETKRKTFFLDLKANNMGRYVKISERSSGKRSTIIVPEENISEFIDKLKGLFS